MKDRAGRSDERRASAQAYVWVNPAGLRLVVTTKHTVSALSVKTSAFAPSIASNCGRCVELLRSC